MMDALVLEPVDLLIYTCVHAGNHKFRIGAKLLLDIKYICEHFQIDWEMLVRRSISWKARRSVLLALIMAKQFANANIPMNVLENLKTDDWKMDIAVVTFMEILCFRTKQEDPRSNPWDLGLERFSISTQNGGGRSSKYAKHVWVFLFPSRTYMVRAYPKFSKGWLLPLAYLERFLTIAARGWRRLRVTVGDKDLKKRLSSHREVTFWLNKIVD
jgi:hypothetical protein